MSMSGPTCYRVRYYWHIGKESQCESNPRQSDFRTEHKYTTATPQALTLEEQKWDVYYVILNVITQENCLTYLH